MRTFIAVEISDPLQKRLTAVSDEVVALLAGQKLTRILRWSGAGKHHITLRFLGETTDVQRQCVGETLANVAAQSAPFALTLGGLGAFPTWPRLRVLWVGVAGDVQSLQRVQGKIETGVQGCGFAAEGQRFHPHVTLARANQNADNQTIAQAGALLAAQTELAQSLGQWEVTELVLVRSELRPEGSVYTPLERFRLARN